MIKCLALIKRKEGISHEAFMNYYENNHAPLARKFMPTALHYERRFLQPDTLGWVEGEAKEMYDCITELWFEDATAMNAALTHLAKPEVAAIIVEDEARFVDRRKIRFFVIERECRSE